MAEDRLQGLTYNVAIKAPCRAATVANITLSGLQTIDGVALAEGDRVLVWQQTNPILNGIYVADNGTWTRDVDFAGTQDCVLGTIVLVTSGSQYGATILQQMTANPVISQTAITFAVTGAAALALASVFMRTTIFPLTTAALTLAAINGLSSTAANTPAGNMTPSAGAWDLRLAAVQVATATAGDNDNSAASTAFAARVAAATVGGVVARGFRDGCILANNAITPNTQLDVSAGAVADSTNAVVMVIAAATMDLGTSTGPGHLDTGALANDTTYHIFAIGKADGTTSLIGTLNPAGPALPGAYVYFRRVGSVKTDGSAHLRLFVQSGHFFAWGVSNTHAYNSGANPGTAALNAAVDVPTGVKVRANLQINNANGGASNSFTYVSDLATTDIAASSTFTDLVGTIAAAAGIKDVWTDTSAQVRARVSFSDAGVTLRIYALGWYDPLGRDN